jgi:hypothetical protein
MASALAAAVCGTGSALPALCVGTSCYPWQPSYYTLKIPFTVDGQAGQDVLQVLQVTTATKETPSTSPHGWIDANFAPWGELETPGGTTAVHAIGIETFDSDSGHASCIEFQWPTGSILIVTMVNPDTGSTTWVQGAKGYGCQQPKAA